MKTQKNHLYLILFLGGLSLLAVLALSQYLFDIYPKIPPLFGVSFSPTYAESLGLDWQKTYLRVLDELEVKNLRLPTYWKEIEPQKGTFSFEEVDFMLNEAQKREAKILLVLGIKQPRWPECQPPQWAYDYTVDERKKEILNIIEKVVLRYRDHPAIWGWQVENEPLYKFGVHCDPPNRQFLESEVKLVRRLDPTRPIVLTDSGEWRFWVTPMRLSDIFGTTLYKVAYHDLLGYVTYPLSPSFYYFKSEIVRKIFAPKNKKTIIAELQAEPWSPKSLAETGVRQQIDIFDVEDFKGNVDFGKKTGFDEVYLWGVEWWYFMEKRGHPEFLEYAKTLFGTSKQQD